MGLFMKCARYLNRQLHDQQPRACYVSNAMYWYLPEPARFGSMQIYLKACSPKRMQLLTQHRLNSYSKKLPGFMGETTCSKNSTPSGRLHAANHCGEVGWAYCL